MLHCEHHPRGSEALRAGSTGAPIAAVGDGGASWKARQLRRLKERSEAEGVSLQVCMYIDR